MPAALATPTRRTVPKIVFKETSTTKRQRLLLTVLSQERYLIEVLCRDE